MAAPPLSPSLRPRRKVLISALAGAAVTVLDFALAQLAGWRQPAEVVAAEVVVTSTLLAYLVPEPDQESGGGT